MGWIRKGDEDDEPKKLMWVTGPAGAGKTAIAGSIAEICEEEGLLAGSFFFSSSTGSEQRRSKRRLVATLVYCMLQHEALECLREVVLSIIDRDPSIFSKRLKDQCRMLLLKPLHNLRHRLDQPSLPKVTIIDGLDGVEADKSRNLERHEARSSNEGDQIDVLSTLLHAAHDPEFPFRILVFSRPERVIQDFFSSQANHISRELRLDGKYEPDRDIALFLAAKLASLRRRYRLPQ